MNNSLYIYKNGVLSRKDNTLRFTSEIYFFGENTINSKLISFLAQNNILVHFFNYYSFYVSSLIPRDSKVSGNLLVKQVGFYTDDVKRMELASAFVKSAGENIYRNLRYYNNRGKELSEPMKNISRLLSSVKNCENIKELMGVEGNIHRIYYEAWNTIIDRDIDFEKRVKRPPDNMINTLISFLNSLVYTTVLSEIYKTQLNPTISYLHEPGVNRFSLSLDIAEIFKPLITDRLIFSLLNRNQISDKHFIKELNYLHLTEEGSKIILTEYDKKLKQTIKHKDLDREVSYRYLMRLECYKIIKHLYGEKEYQSFVIWW